MNKNKNSFSFGLNIGSSSVLLVFVLLCLVFFATLSIISANADNKLSHKILERTTAYYNACNQAEMTLSELDQTLVDAYQNTESESQYFSMVGQNKSYTFQITDLQQLEVDVMIQYPSTDTDTFYNVQRWQVVTTLE